MYTNAFSYRFHRSCKRFGFVFLPCIYTKTTGGLDLTSSLEEKFGQGHQISRKTWEVLVPQEAKIGAESRILGSYMKLKRQNLGYLSPIILEAKFEALTGISEENFRAKPPDLLKWKYSLGRYQTVHIVLSIRSVLRL